MVWEQKLWCQKNRLFFVLFLLLKRRSCVWYFHSGSEGYIELWVYFSMTNRIEVITQVSIIKHCGWDWEVVFGCRVYVDEEFRLFLLWREQLLRLCLGQAVQLHHHHLRHRETHIFVPYNRGEGGNGGGRESERECGRERVRRRVRGSEMERERAWSWSSMTSVSNLKGKHMSTRHNL